MAPFGCLGAVFLASFGHLGTGWAQKGPQSCQKSDFGSILNAIVFDLGHALPTFRVRGWDSSLEVGWRLLEDYVEYLMRFLSSDLCLALSMSVSFFLSLSLFPCRPVSLFPSLPSSLLEAHAVELCLPPWIAAWSRPREACPKTTLA